MIILTIGPSPHLLTKTGRLHRDTILALMESGHYVESLVWHHDISYFLPSEINEYTFDYKGKRICRIHPFTDDRGNLAIFSYDVMKKVQPRVVVTIGSATDTTDIHCIKAMYPHLFKWIVVLTEGQPFINENYQEPLGYPDIIISTSRVGVEAVKRLVATQCEYIPYGPDHETFKPLGVRPDEFGVINCAKNAQMSNVTAVIAAIAQNEGMEGYMHTNIDDLGESDLRLLIRRYGCSARIGVPDGKFVSVREGVTDVFMNELYNRYHVVVDASMQSATALSMLEAMATGCVPVGVDFGAVGEVLSLMPEEHKFLTPHTTLTGPREETYAIVSPVSLGTILGQLSSKFLTDKGWFADAQKNSIKVANIFSKEQFQKRLKEEVERVLSYDHAIVVDSF